MRHQKCFCFKCRLERLGDAMLQLQMIVPSLKADASLSVTLKRDKQIFMNIETVAKLPAVSYQQTVSFRYGND